MLYLRIKSCLPLVGLFLSLVTANVVAEEKSEAGFNAYLAEIKTEAISKGFDGALVDSALATASFRPTVVKADKNQPEKKNHTR